jgi:hypothetical protein
MATAAANLPGAIIGRVTISPMVVQEIDDAAKPKGTAC